MRVIRILAFGGLFLSASAALGQVSGSWVGGSSGSWSNAANWSSNPQFPSGGGVATLGLQNAGVLDVSLDSAVSLDFLGFFGPAVSRVNGGSLTFSPAGVVHVDRNDASGTALAPESRIPSTASSFTKIGDGTLSIVGTQNAPVRVTEGVLRTTAGSGTIELNGGTLLNPNSRSLVLGTAGGVWRDDSFDFISRSVPTSGVGSLVLTSYTTGLLKEVRLSSEMLHTGHTTIRDGRWVLQPTARFSGGGTIEVMSNLYLGVTGTLTANQISDDSQIILRSGGLVNSNNVPISNLEDVGTISVASGRNVITARVRTPAIHHADRTMLSMGGSSVLVSESISMIGNGAPGTSTVGIVPWVTDLLYTWQNGELRPLTAAETTATVPTGGNLVNWRPTADTNLAQAVSVNSLHVASGSLGGVGTIHVASGAVRLGSSVFTPVVGTPLDFGDQEGIVASSGNGDAIVSAPFFGNDGVLFDGRIRLSGLSTYTGPTHIFGNVRVDTQVMPGQPGALGADSSPVILSATDAYWIGGTTLNAILPGTLRLGATTFGRDIQVVGHNDDVAQIIAISGINRQISGNIQLDGNLILNRSGSPMTVSGNISGDGKLYVAQTVALDGDNSFSGGVHFIDFSPDLRISTDTALGTGTLNIRSVNSTAEVNLRPLGGLRTISNAMIVDGSLSLSVVSTVTPGAFNFTGPIALMPNAQVSGSAATTFSGPIAAYGTFTSRATHLAISPARFPSLLNISAGKLQLIESSTATAAGTLTINSGTTSTATLDVTNGALLIDLSAATLTSSAVANVRNWVTRGYANGSWNGVGAIVSSAAAGSGILDAVGYAAASDVFASFPAEFMGREVDSDDVLIRYTLAGDSDLNTIVNITDFARLAANFNLSATWSNGDFNYDGTANIADFSLLAANFNQSLPADAARIPESGSLSLIALLMLRLARARRVTFARSSPPTKPPASFLR